MWYVVNKKLLADNKSILTHYVLITDSSRLLCKQSKANQRLYYCRRCLQHFRAQEKLYDHVNSCKNIGCVQRTIFPDAKNKFIKFKNFKNKIPAPYVVYADFQAINNKNVKEENKTTEKLTSHQICSYAYKLICIIDDKFSKPVKLYRGENAAYQFIEDMLSEEAYCE